MDPQFIAVSKLCCPVCWELLQILRGATEDFSVRGHHATMYPVELPPWIPDYIVFQMLARFQQYLIGELLKLTVPATRHKLSPSLESINTDSSGSTDGAFGPRSL
jgi:hypothetical protein